MRRPTEKSQPTHPRPLSLRPGALVGWLAGWIGWLFWRGLLVVFLLVLAFAIFNPPTTLTIISNAREYPIAERRWARIEDISPVMLRSVVAAEDANFCTHWGFDMQEIRRVIAQGGSGGASTISQQVVKNVYLWQERSWPRKALEAGITPLVEAIWTKRRILEVYVNVAEFGPGIFGVHAAAQQFYKTTPDKLTAVQSARLAAVLPAPKHRDAKVASRRSRAIADGAATIARDGRDFCFR
ncbi:MAG: monofunctional biosynthetic peptidoglycan transglycosylase [Paracoccus sp. (in: a-proteobacteria)]|nr:monofunctional biosynthetic peptidoglycan transglycosylase [Paracoccus sp. (in: a-proteobacteria)]